MVMSAKSVVFGVFVAFMFGGLAQAADAQLAKDQVVRYGSQYGDIGSLDPHFASIGSDMSILNCIYNGLVRFLEGTIEFEKIEPDLAERWERSADFTKWTFYLRKNVKWHKDFGEFTAEDVKFSIERVMDPKTASPFRGQFANFNEVKVVDKHTVQLTLKRPDPFLLLRVMDYQGGIVVSKKAVEKYGKDFKLNPVGTGPFEFVEYRPRERVVLKRYDSYFRGKPILERVEYIFMQEINSRMLAFQKGELDCLRFADQYIPVLRSMGATIDLPWPGEYNAYFINITKKPLDDIRVRRALAHGINRKELMKFMGEGVLGEAYSACPNGYFGFTDQVTKYEYDPAKAKELLKQAGLPNGFTMKVYMSSSETMKMTAEIIQEQWRKIGVNMDVEIVDHSTYHSMIRKDANPVIAYNCARIPICDIYMTQFLHSNSIVGKPTAVTNFSHYTAIDDFLDQARMETDPEKQKKLYAEAQKKVLEDCVMIPTVIRPNFNGARRPYVDLGYNFKASMFYDYVFNETSRILKH